jgi:hypothetical protein
MLLWKRCGVRSSKPERSTNFWGKAKRCEWRRHLISIALWWIVRNKSFVGSHSTGNSETGQFCLQHSFECNKGSRRGRGDIPSFRAHADRAVPVGVWPGCWPMSESRQAGFIGTARRMAGSSRPQQRNAIRLLPKRKIHVSHLNAASHT